MPRCVAIGVAAVLLSLVVLAGCAKEEPTTPAVTPPPPPITQTTPTEVSPVTWTLESTAFGNNQTMPAKYTGDGQDVSPPLKWSDPPAGTQEIALICDDPDAPRGTWVHWVLWGLSAERRELPENVAKTETLPELDGAKQGKNDFPRIGYNGPKPPPGKPHHYSFRVYALDAALDLQPGATKADLERAMQGHILAKGELVGVYQR
jgi:hypothetical protein